MTLFLITMTSACAQRPIAQGDGLYPYATYQHQVKIEIKDNPRKLDMRGVVVYGPGQLKVVGLSPFGTTLFRIHEDLATGLIKKEFYMEAIKMHEDQFMQFYSLIRALLTGPKERTKFKQSGAEFQVSAPDSRGVYRKVQVEHSRFSLSIEVTHYEL